MNRRHFLSVLSAAPLLGQRTRKPNVLFIAADDLNTRVGCYGDPIVKTPHIDRLATRGVLFQRAYCQFPLCGPSRASLLTGLRPDTTRVLGNNIDFREFHPDAVTLPGLFKRNGWYAAREGKMFHMNVPGEVTTPKYQDERSWHHSVSPGGAEQKSAGEGRRLNPPGVNFGMQWIATATPDGQSDANAADNALALLEERRGEPFFLGLGFLRPHLPFVAPGRFFDLYPLESMPLPVNPPADLDDIPEASKAVRPHLLHHMKMDEPRIREALRGYFASTSFMDDQLGRVLSGLERMGLASNTIVVFWGDHGWHLGEHTRWQKMSLMEPSARVPLIVSAPGRKGNGSACRAIVELVDLYPTIADVCCLKAPAEVEGQSFAMLLDNPKRRFKQAAFTQLQYEQINGRSVRTERFRYIRWEGAGGGEELYDHTSDPQEFKNLATSQKHSTVLDEHRNILDRGWRAALATV